MRLLNISHVYLTRVVSDFDFFALILLEHVKVSSSIAKMK